LVRVGERHGNLAASLDMVSRLFRDRAVHRLERIDTLIEPVLILFIGGLMAAVVVWVLLPVYGVLALSGGGL